MRWHVQEHPVLSKKEQEDIAFGKNRAEGWMEGKPMGKGSSRLQTKVHRDAATTFREKHTGAGRDFPSRSKPMNFRGVF